MIDFDRWYLVVGSLLILMVIVRPLIQRLPLTTAMVYLGLGWLFGVAGWITLDLFRHGALLERLSEIAVIISLYGAGLKLRLPIDAGYWRLPIALAFVSMSITVGLITAVGVYWLGLPLGAAVILGAVLAPTDPVLASDVQVAHSLDTERVRFTLTAEAGFNDGTAFPFIMLGLGLLGAHELGDGAWRWWLIDVAWAIGGGLACGALIGALVARSIVVLRQRIQAVVGLDDFLAIGIIAFVYGAALLLHTYGFLAVFAAGVAMRTLERESSDADSLAKVIGHAEPPEQLAGHQTHAPAFMAEAVLRVDEHLERIAELTLVLLTGALLAVITLPPQTLGIAALLFCVIRPLAVAPLAMVCGMTSVQTALVSWFGIRGIGSIYYLFYAFEHGVPETLVEPLATVVLWVIALSICLHGISVTPLMRYYKRQNSHD